MGKREDGDAAFPHFRDEYYRGDGMSLRDWFAGKAVTGIVAAFGDSDREMEADDWELTAREAYALADAMLAERAK